jgi:hypothetical protein
MNASNKEVRQNIKYGVILVVPFILWMLPANFFDTGQSICLSKLLMERDCPGCGMTRAVQHAMHFEFAEAWNFNKMIVILLPIFVFIYVRVAIDVYKRVKTRFNRNQ